MTGGAAAAAAARCNWLQTQKRLKPPEEASQRIMETLNAIVNRIGRVFRPSPDTSSVVSALRVPEVGEALRRQKNLRGPGR